MTQSPYSIPSPTIDIGEGGTKITVGSRRGGRRDTLSPKTHSAICALVAIAMLQMALCGCDLIETHPYDADISGARLLTATNIEQIEALRLGPAFRFAFISDTQRWYDDTNDAVDDINSRDDIDFVVHGGDMTDFGLTKEFEWMRDCLLRFRMPWVTVIGNHDFLGHGENIYRSMFGDYNYAFTVGHVRFEMLNTNALEADYTTPIPDFSFLEREIAYLDSLNSTHTDSISRTICVMHSRPGDEQFNNNVAVAFDRYLRLLPGMERDTAAPDSPLPSFCLNGHNHRKEAIEPFDDGIVFYGIEEIHDREYYIVTVNPDDTHHIESVTF